MKTFDFIQVTISHNLKDPHPKALEPDCFSPLLMVTTQFLKGRVRERISDFLLLEFPFKTLDQGDCPRVAIIMLTEFVEEEWNAPPFFLKSSYPLVYSKS